MLSEYVCMYVCIAINYYYYYSNKEKKGGNLWL